MFDDLVKRLSGRSSDSDTRWELLLSAVRAFRAAEKAAKAGKPEKERELAAEYAEPVVLPEALRRTKP
jgi:hypothetical protein